MNDKEKLEILEDLEKRARGLRKMLQNSINGDTTLPAGLIVAESEDLIVEVIEKIKEAFGPEEGKRFEDLLKRNKRRE